MKNIKYLLCFLIAWGIIFSSNITAQVESKNGYALPPNSPVNVLIVFAELVGPCAGTPVSGWDSGELPDNAELYLDHVLSANPTTFLSRYYKDMSLGDHNVIGDYYGATVQVPCSMLGSWQYDGPRQAIEVLNNEWLPDANGNYYTFNGHELEEFDDYQSLSSGFLKLPGNPDGNIDATIVLWRNHFTFSCGSGLGVGNNFGSAPTLGDKTVKLYGSWDFCPNNILNGDRFFVAEYFHSLYGHNNFHTGGGADYGSYMFGATASFSTTAQSGSSSNVACGWDRQFLDWRGNRQYRISASDQAGLEVESDISAATHPGTSTFILNDFVTVGDAVRIKLPHFDWQQNGDKKNQYLWIENHQMVNEFDHSKSPQCEDWVPGMHAYIQSGKNLITGDVYGGSYAEPNDLNDWLFPLPAEGRWDFYYSHADANTANGNCVWGNSGTPYSIQYPDGSRLSNPFTGYTDAYVYIDSDQDGQIVFGSNDSHQPRFQKWLGTPTPGSPPPPTLPNWGDHLDPFTTTGQKLSISTNPAPMPVYTLREGQNVPSNYDNRSIHLNNISVKILNDDYYNVGNNGPKSIWVEIRFDDPCITEDVRWCGNVVLENDPLDQLNRDMRIDVKPNKCITLDKGLSPTKLEEVSPGSGDFTDPSFLHILDGTEMILQVGAKLKVINGSTFHVQSGATLVIGPDAEIYIDATSHICIEEGAFVYFESPTSVITIDGLPYQWDYDLQDLVLSNATTNYYAFNQIRTSGTAPGVTMPPTGNVLLEAGELITLQPNTIITPNSGQTFIARINNPNNCTAVENYDEAMPPDEPGSASIGTTDKYHDHQHLVQSGHEHPDDIDLEKRLDGLTIFPNPASDVVYIQDKFTTGLPVQVIIYNGLGKQIDIKNFATDKSAMAINTASWQSGLYLLKIRRGKMQTSKKLFVE